VRRPPSKRLSLRENQVVDLISQGKLNKEIAFQLHLSEMTIKVYVSKIFQKVGVTNRTELAVWALTLRRESAA
jgi:DNA-binding NarL/FixJ family response regulator